MRALLKHYYFIYRTAAATSIYYYILIKTCSCASVEGAQPLQLKASLSSCLSDWQYGVRMASAGETSRWARHSSSERPQPISMSRGTP
jgi:hypothetical protein